MAENNELQFVSAIDEMQREIDALRLNGETLIAQLKNENSNVKRNKQLDVDTKETILNKNKESILAAKEVAAQNAGELKEKIAELSNFAKGNYNDVIKEKKAKYKAENAEAKAVYLAGVKAAKEKYQAALAEAKAKKASIDTSDKEAVIDYKNSLKDIKNAYVIEVKECKNKYKEIIDAHKDDVHYLELEKYKALNDAYNKKLPIIDKVTQKIENKVYNFNVNSFLLNNGLYITIILLLLVAVIFYAAKYNGFLLNQSSILLILNQVSPKIFLALGVAGLIVLAGTDLSVGRLVGLGAVVTGMLVTTTGETSLKILGNTISFAGIPLAVRVIMGILLSVILCVAGSSLAGFFTAKFKMHPFISTLATQLMTFGILAYITGNSFTGSPDDTVKNIFAGNIGGFPVMIIYAVIGIAVMWFIWNKTKFGKNMFAVGGNAEAATVSGISVFWTTLFVFMLAGVYYGIGSSIYGIYTGNVRAQTGQGMELDAIAACVVGGVSFSGGVGKISGVVIGAILFQTISVVLPLIGINDANFQLAIKGFIILAAVTLDCAKYLKKK